MRSIAPILWLTAAGVGLGGFTLQSLRSSEMASIRGEFSAAASNYQYAVQREIESNLAALIALKGYVEVTPNPNSPDFEQYAAECMKAFPSLLSLEWAPHIRDEDRNAFESSLVRRGLAFPYIRSNLAPTPARALKRSDYYPVEFMLPSSVAARVTGYDLGATGPIRRLLNRASQTPNVLVAGKITLVEKDRDGAGIPAYAAVLDRWPGRKGLRGYVVAIFQFADVLESGLRKLKPEAIDIRFFDLTAEPGHRLLHVHLASGNARRETAQTETQALTDADFKAIGKFQVGGRSWAMVLTPAGRYIESRRTWQPWSALGAVLVATGLAAGFLLRKISKMKREAELQHLRSRRAAEEALRRSEERYALAARGSKDGLWDWDLLSQEVYYSSRWKAMLGYDDSEIEGGPEEWLGRIHPDERARFEEEMSRHCSGEAPHFQIEHRMRHRDGSYRWFLTRGVAVFNDRGEAERMAGSQTDITEGKIGDTLTGLASRILLRERLQCAIERAGQTPGYLFAILFLDIDRFKLVNDSLGHVAGDKLLMQVAQRLKHAVRSAPVDSGQVTIARLGGDEFAVLACGLKCSEEAAILAETIRRGMEPEFDLEGKRLFVSFSIGVRSGEAGGCTEDHLRDADIAMYEAKGSGVGRFAVFDQPMRQRAADRLGLDTDLRYAIENGELLLHFQPKVTLPDRHLAGFEALVRWNHPRKGLIMPAEFISIAEETGLIIPLGNWVLHEACRQLAVWRKNFAGQTGLSVSVNLSSKQLRHPDLVSEVLSILDRTGLDPRHLELEVTEGAILEGFESASIKLAGLRKRGIQLHIDDFGTGHSSLSCLHRLPLDALKIDRSFVSEIAHTRENLQIVRTLVTLARTLGVNAIAEGVETLEQLEYLNSLGCDAAQGFLFSRALPPAGVEIFLSERRELFVNRRELTLT